MSDDEDVFDVSRIDVWGEPTTFEVDRERTIAYAEATNDTIAQHVDGTYAPPVFAVVPPFTQLAAVTMEPVPPHLMLRIVHGEQDMRFHRPIVAGDVLSCRGKVIGIHGKGSGVVVTTLLETRDAAGELVNEQYVAGFFRGGKWPHEAGQPFPAHELPERIRDAAPDAVTADKFDTDQTYRYAPASGDPMPIHTDEDFAKSMGFPGIIIHGLCTMAFASRAVIDHACPDDPARLKRLVVRFSAPGLPGQAITTRIWADGKTEAGAYRYVFETANDEGSLLIKDGLAEVAS